MRFLKFHRLGENKLDMSGKFCPVCKNKNDLEAIVCIHCGASLEPHLNDSAATKTTEVQIEGVGKFGELLVDEALIPAGGIAIYVEGTSSPIFSSSNNEFVIGRKVGETSDVLLDLSVLGGYHLGLSRRHATIRRAAQGYEVIDLSSSNGTWLNNERLIPNKPYRMASGSQLRLARMKLYVMYRPVPETKQKT